MTFKQKLLLMLPAAPLKFRKKFFLSVVVLFLCVIADSGRGGATARTIVASMPPRLTPAQWDDLIKAADKRITSLRLRAIIRLRSYTTNSQAEGNNKILQKILSPQAWQFYKHNYGSIPGQSAAGYNVQPIEVQLDWNIPARQINARTIWLGVQTIGLGGQIQKEPMINIWVVGQRLEWYASFSHGIWSVYLDKLYSSWAQQKWSSWWSTTGPADIKIALVPFRASFSRWPKGRPHFKRRLILQNYDPSTGLIQLAYEEFYKGKPRTISSGGMHGKYEEYYQLKLSGGLRLYRKVIYLVNSFQRVPQEEFDFRRFRKSGGVWFPTRIHGRGWGGKYLKRLEIGETIRVSHLAVNKIFPPRTFSYSPPFGARVYDGLTKKTYIAGSYNPNSPLTKKPGRKNVRGGGK